MSSRLLVVNRRLSGRTVLDLLRSHFHLGPVEVRKLLKHDGIRLAGNVCRDLTQRVRAGQKLLLDTHVQEARHGDASRKRQSTTTRSANEGRQGQPPSKIPIVYIDNDIVVADKPAGLTTVRHASEKANFGARAQRFLPPTLVDVLSAQVTAARRGRLRAVHRLDKETSGLVVLALTAEAERGFGLKFREHDVQRTYLAIVRGRASSQTIRSHLIRDRGDGRRGSSSDQHGQLAITHVKVVEELGAFTLVECRLETGRTHQVRIHLGEQGTPLCGEQVYDRPIGGQPLPDDSGARRPALHAATLAFEHPVTRKWLSFSSPLPEDMDKLLEKMRRKS